MGSLPKVFGDQQGMMDKHNLSTLQKHIVFFDRNSDGVIYPSETYEGFRAIGCGVLLSGAASIFINVGLSRKTRPGKPFSLKFPIEVKNIHLAKHGSDSGVYDKEGRFVAEKFEEIFAKHARTHPDALTSNELKMFIKSNREPRDYYGWVAAFFEWQILYYLGKDKHGLLRKETVRDALDGSLFEHMAELNSSKNDKQNSL